MLVHIFYIYFFPLGIIVMHTYQIRVSDEIISKFLWWLEYFHKDIKEGKISNFDFNNFEKKLNENV